MSIPTIREFEQMHINRFDSYYDLAIAFATAHCEAQAKAFLENCSLDAYYGEEVNEDEYEGTYKLPHSKSGMTYKISDNSKYIYPLTNIK